MPQLVIVFTAQSAASGPALWLGEPVGRGP